MLRHNTQNISNAQPQSSVSIVELEPQNVDSYSGGKSKNSKFDAENPLKTTSTLQITPEEVESHNDYEKNLHIDLAKINSTNDDVVRQPKLSLSKYENEVTTEKVPLKADKSVDTLSTISEPHDVYSDVESNIIDVGQQPLGQRNGSMYSLNSFFRFSIF